MEIIIKIKFCDEAENTIDGLLDEIEDLSDEFSKEYIVNYKPSKSPHNLDITKECRDEFNWFTIK